MRVTLASFHVAGQLSINVRLRSDGYFLVIYGTYVLIMNVSMALVTREFISWRFTRVYSLHGKKLDVNFILMR